MSAHRARGRSSGVRDASRLPSTVGARCGAEGGAVPLPSIGVPHLCGGWRCPPVRSGFGCSQSLAHQRADILLGVPRLVRLLLGLLHALGPPGGLRKKTTPAEVQPSPSVRVQLSHLVVMADHFPSPALPVSDSVCLRGLPARPCCCSREQLPPATSCYERDC